MKRVIFQLNAEKLFINRNIKVVLASLSRSTLSALCSICARQPERTHSFLFAHCIQCPRLQQKVCLLLLTIAMDIGLGQVHCNHRSGCTEIKEQYGLSIIEIVCKVVFDTGHMGCILILFSHKNLRKIYAFKKQRIL